MIKEWEVVPYSEQEIVETADFASFKELDEFIERQELDKFIEREK